MRDPLETIEDEFSPEDGEEARKQATKRGSWFMSPILPLVDDQLSDTAFRILMGVYQLYGATKHDWFKLSELRNVCRRGYGPGSRAMDDRVINKHLRTLERVGYVKLRQDSERGSVMVRVTYFPCAELGSPKRRNESGPLPVLNHWETERLDSSRGPQVYEPRPDPREATCGDSGGRNKDGRPCGRHPKTGELLTETQERRPMRWMSSVPLVRIPVARHATETPHRVLLLLIHAVLLRSIMTGSEAPPVASRAPGSLEVLPRREGLGTYVLGVEWGGTPEGPPGGQGSFSQALQRVLQALEIVSTPTQQKSAGDADEDETWWEYEAQDGAKCVHCQYDVAVVGDSCAECADPGGATPRSSSRGGPYP